MPWKRRPFDGSDLTRALNIADLRAPKNVHLMRGAPHDAVMKDVSLVVTQGGHGTVCRALINGLPQLILPNGRDQGDNAARVEVKGAGLRLPPTRVGDRNCGRSEKADQGATFPSLGASLGECHQGRNWFVQSRSRDGGNRGRPARGGVRNAPTSASLTSQQRGGHCHVLCAPLMPLNRPFMPMRRRRHLTNVAIGRAVTKSPGNQYSGP